jgi:hypothetical protein
MKTSAFVCLAAALVGTEARLQVEEGVLAGTENLGMAGGLTDKQLAIQRQMAEWTIFNMDGDDFQWRDWYVGDAGGFLAGPRFPLGFMSYALGMAQFRTPQYTEVNEMMLKHIALRFREEESWNARPDPVRPSSGNVMYTGHVTQNLALYESISGDVEFGATPWTYNTNDEYTFAKIQDEHYRWQEHYQSGGISCGGSIFMVCNGNAHSANALYDAVHETNYTALRDKWTDFLNSYEHPAASNGEGALITRENSEAYSLTWKSILTNQESWATGDIACGMEDGWTGTELFRFADETDLGFVRSAWNKLQDNPGWVDEQDGSSYFKMTGALDNLDVIGCGLANNGCPDELMHSFYVIMEEQNRQDGDTKLRKERVLQWEEKTYGTQRDMDGDGYSESYAYWNGDEGLQLPLYGAPTFYGDMWITANLLNGMTYDREWGRKHYHEAFFKSKFAGFPTLHDVNFPEIVVAKAIFDEAATSLDFTLAINAPTDAGSDSVTVQTKGLEVKSVTVNGESFEQWTRSKDGNSVNLDLEWSDRADVRVFF